MEKPIKFNVTISNNGAPKRATVGVPVWDAERDEWRLKINLEDAESTSEAEVNSSQPN